MASLGKAEEEPALPAEALTNSPTYPQLQDLSLSSNSFHLYLSSDTSDDDEGKKEEKDELRRASNSLDDKYYVSTSPQHKCSPKFTLTPLINVKMELFSTPDTSTPKERKNKQPNVESSVALPASTVCNSHSFSDISRECESQNTRKDHPQMLYQETKKIISSIEETSEPLEDNVTLSSNIQRELSISHHNHHQEGGTVPVKKKNFMTTGSGSTSVVMLSKLGLTFHNGIKEDTKNDRKQNGGPLASCHTGKPYPMRLLTTKAFLTYTSPDEYSISKAKKSQQILCEESAAEPTMCWQSQGSAKSGCQQGIVKRSTLIPGRKTIIQSLLQPPRKCQSRPLSQAEIEALLATPVNFIF